MTVVNDSPRRRELVLSTNKDRAGSCGPGTLRSTVSFQLSTWPRRSWRHHTSTEYVPHIPAKKQQGPRGIFHEMEGIEDAMAGMSVTTDVDQVGRHIARNADMSCTTVVGMEHAAYLRSMKLTRHFFLVFYAAATMCDASVCGCLSRLRSQEGFVLTRNAQLPSLGAAPRLFHNTLQHQDQKCTSMRRHATHRLRLTPACVTLVPLRPLELANAS